MSSNPKDRKLQVGDWVRLMEEWNPDRLLPEVWEIDFIDPHRDAATIRLMEKTNLYKIIEQLREDSIGRYIERQVVELMHERFGPLHHMIYQGTIKVPNVPLTSMVLDQTREQREKWGEKKDVIPV